MKKLIASIVLSGTLVAGACATVGCSTGDGSSARTDDGVQITLSDDMRNACDFYAYGAASVGSIVAANAARTTEAEGESSVVDGTADGQTETDEDETQIDEGDADSDNAVMPDEDTDFDSAWGVDSKPEKPDGDFGGGWQNGKWQFGDERWDGDMVKFPDGGGRDEHRLPDVGDPNGWQNPEDGEGQIPSANLSDEEIETLNGYMTLVENLLADGGLGCVRYESDREEYSVKEVVSFGDLSGNVTSYTTYYNATLDYTDEYDGFAAENYSIVGVMVIDGTEYALQGVTEMVTEDGEAESECYYKVTLSDGNYVIMEREECDGETSLSYKLVQDRKVVEKISFEYEKEENETELKMTLEKDGVRTEFEFSEEVVGERRIVEVLVVENDTVSKFSVEIVKDDDGNDVYRYTFGKGCKDMQKPNRTEMVGRR